MPMDYIFKWWPQQYPQSHMLLYNVTLFASKKWSLISSFWIYEGFA